MAAAAAARSDVATFSGHPRASITKRRLDGRCATNINQTALLLDGINHQCSKDECQTLDGV
jgi:hypothetical protein